MYLVKNKSGGYSPYDNNDYEANKKIGAGTVVKATVSRNYLFHKKAFALLEIGFSNQERYTNFELYRKIILCKAGYYDIVDGGAGKTYYIPHSISFEAMNQIDFQKCYDAMLKVISNEMSTAPEAIQAELNGFY